MEVEKLKNLLAQVRAISERYSKINELTGENFNVFRILKLESSEVRMHSAFIAELLNPKGSHGQEDLFLKLFTQLFCFKGNEIDTVSCVVEIEKHAGFISEDGSEGGRIDIVITDGKKNRVIIENKIYAGDQRNQLVRYHNFHNTADIIYLTLDGKLPTEWSKGDLLEDTHFKCLSYKADILRWLELCRKEVAVLPIIREAITHYINLIKYLTNQTINNSMQEELSKVILSNLESSFLIKNGLNDALEFMLNKMDEDLKEVANQFNLGYVRNISADFKKNYSGFWFWDKDWRYLNIGFQFHYREKQLLYGFQTKHDPIQKPIPDELRNKVSGLVNESSKSNSWWVILNRMDDQFDDWTKYEAWKGIEDGTFKKVVREKIKYLLDLKKGVSL